MSRFTISTKRIPTLTSTSVASSRSLKFTMSLSFTIPCVGTNCPALLKEWFDQVLTQGWAYGDGAVALVGKRAMSAVSTGGSGTAFTPEGASRHVIRDFLLPFDQTVHLCGMTYLEPLCFTVLTVPATKRSSSMPALFAIAYSALRDGSSEGGG